MNLLLRPITALAQGDRPPIWRQGPRPQQPDDDEIIPIIVAMHERRRVALPIPT